MAFTVTFPADWKISKTTEKQVSAVNGKNNLIFIAQTSNDSGMSLDTLTAMYVKIFSDPSMSMFSSSKPGAKDTVMLGGGIEATRQVITGISKAGQMPSTMYILCARADGKIYSIMIFVLNSGLESNKAVIEDLYTKILLGKKSLP